MGKTSGIDSTQIEQVIFRSGETLFEEGELTFYFYIIQSGEVEIYKTAEDGSKLLLAIVRQGTSIGEFAMIDRHPRSATAVALTTVEATRISETAYQHLLSELPDWAVSMMKALVERIRNNNEIVRRSTASSPFIRKQLDSAEYDTDPGKTYAGQTPMLGSGEDPTQE